MYLQATTCHVWAAKGQTPIIRVGAGRASTHFYGSLNLLSGEEIAMRSDLMNNEISAQHLQMLLDAYPDLPILLFWDRAPWHRGPAITKLLEENPRLETVFFPPGSPELNPQEHVWKEVRKAISHNHTEKKLPELAEKFLNKLNADTYKSAFLDKYGATPVLTMFK